MKRIYSACLGIGLAISVGFLGYSALAGNTEGNFEMSDKDTLENRGPGGMDVPSGKNPKATPKPTTTPGPSKAGKGYFK